MKTYNDLVKWNENTVTLEEYSALSQVLAANLQTTKHKKLEIRKLNSLCSKKNIRTKFFCTVCITCHYNKENTPA
jgi:hypothetical protein